MVKRLDNRGETNRCQEGTRRTKKHSGGHWRSTIRHVCTDNGSTVDESARKLKNGLTEPIRWNKGRNDGTDNGIKQAWNCRRQQKNSSLDGGGQAW